MVNNLKKLYSMFSPEEWREWREWSPVAGRTLMGQRTPTLSLPLTLPGDPPGPG